jgi:hypothetical protein
MRIHKSERDHFGDYTIQACAWSFIPEEAMTIGDVSDIEEMAKQCWIKIIEPKIMLAKLEGYDISVDDIAISVSEDWCYGTQHKFEIMCEAHCEEMKCIEIIKQCIAEADQDMFVVFEDIFDTGIAYDCIIECDSEEEAA